MKLRALFAGALCALALAGPAAASTGNVAGVGFNLGAQLGAGYKNNVELVAVPSVITGVKALSPGDGFSLVLMNNGTVKGWGGDIYGQLGNGRRESFSMVPVEVKGLTGVIGVAAAGGHALAVLSNGKVATWGGTIYGQLGNGQTTHGKEAPGDFSSVPVFPVISGVKAVAAGGATDYALLNDGTMMAWGENKSGQILDGTTVEKPFPTVVKGVSNVKAISAGGIGGQGGHVMALTNDGRLLTWGSNGRGQLGIGNNAPTVGVRTVSLAGVVAISASVSHSLAIMADGSVTAWGSNGNGELGAATTLFCSRITPEPCSPTPLPVAGLSNVTSISAGFRFSLAASGGQAYGFGWNQLGQLGNGTAVDEPTPGPMSELTGVSAIATGGHHSLMLLDGAAPLPTLIISSEVRALKVSWRSPVVSERWLVTWRPVTKPLGPWAKFVYLPAASRSYTVNGLASGSYEVRVQNKTFGTRIITGSPVTTAQAEKALILEG